MSSEDDIVPTKLALNALRDSGYNNSTYAIAELIDNAIQANAKHVEVIFYDKEEFSGGRKKTRLDKIAIVDNGDGMTDITLKKALQFGNGTRLNNRKGIGRFGMGLPNSSISQCRRVDVYTWQNSKNVYKSYIDLNLVDSGDMVSIPSPELTSIPEYIKNNSKHLTDHGTVVIWSKLDRCNWKKSKTIIDKTEFLVGRLYRKFLDKNDVKIRMASIIDDKLDNEKYVRKNDPGYMMKQTSTPSPYDVESMFEKYGDENWEEIKPIKYNGVEHMVKIRYSLVKHKVRENTRNAGSAPYGKHAGKNIGISIVREGRELSLDQGLVTGYDPRERWWGIELEFPATLDELFGLTNNKQVAARFSYITRNLDSILNDEGKKQQEVLAELEEENDMDYPLIQIVMEIKKHHGQIMQLIDLAKDKKESDKRHDRPDKSSQGAKDRKDGGHIGKTDEDDNISDSDQQEATKQGFIEMGYPDDVADEMSKKPNNSDKKYEFVNTPLSGTQFFDVARYRKKLFIKINKNHAAFKNLMDLSRDLPETMELDEAKERLIRTYDGLVLLLSAWARLEDELAVDEELQQVQDIRINWGKILQEYLKYNSEL